MLALRCRCEELAVWTELEVGHTRRGRQGGLEQQNERLALELDPEEAQRDGAFGGRRAPVVWGVTKYSFYIKLDFTA